MGWAARLSDSLSAVVSASDRSRVAAVDVLDLLPLLTPGWERPDHLEPIARLFRRVAAGVPVRAVVTAPPRHGKTELILHGICWLLCRDPRAVCYYGSYSADISHSKSKLCRTYAIRCGYRVVDSYSSAGEWRCAEGGGLLSSGVGGPLTGQGISCLAIVDDPYKNREEAESPVYRRRVSRHLRGTVLTRLEPRASCIVTQARWHRDDLYGELEREGWEAVHLPAISSDGRALWPSRWPVHALEARRRDVHEYEWASLYMGMPRPEGDRLFTAEPLTHAFHTLADLPPGAVVQMGIDLAYSDSRRADYTCAVVVCVWSGGYAVLDHLRGRGDLLDQLLSLWRRWRCPTVVWHCSGVEEQIARYIRERGLPVVTRPAGQTKFVRALEPARLWQQQRIFVPTGAKWVSEFVDELHRFTGAESDHDDQVDALVSALHGLPDPSECSRVAVSDDDREYGGRLSFRRR